MIVSVGILLCNSNIGLISIDTLQLNIYIYTCSCPINVAMTRLPEHCPVLALMQINLLNPFKTDID